MMPVVYVSWNDAARFVNWLHNGAAAESSTETGVYNMSLPQQDRARLAGATYWLPNEDEWVKAAYYNPATETYSLYPTQTNTIPNSRVGDAIDANSGNFYRDVPADPAGINKGYAVTGSTTFVNTQNYLTDVGAYSEADSFYGTFDQGGNVWEWTERVSGSSRGLRGASWYFHLGDHLRASGRDNFDPTSEYNLVGFRVASVPEPSTAMLILLGGSAFWLMRRRHSTL